MAVGTGLAQIQSRQYPSTEKGKWTQGPILTKKLSAADTCWQRVNQFSTTECHWVDPPHSRASLMGKSNELIKTKSMCFCELFCFILFCNFFYLICFVMIFIMCFCGSFFFERERNNNKLGK